MSTFTVYTVLSLLVAAANAFSAGCDFVRYKQVNIAIAKAACRTPGLPPGHSQGKLVRWDCWSASACHDRHGRRNRRSCSLSVAIITHLHVRDSTFSLAVVLLVLVFRQPIKFERQGGHATRRTLDRCRLRNLRQIHTSGNAVPQLRAKNLCVKAPRCMSPAIARFIWRNRAREAPWASTMLTTRVPFRRATEKNFRDIMGVRALGCDPRQSKSAF